MRNHSTGFSLMMITALSVSCAPSLQVTSDYAKAVNFQQYKTFAVDTFRMNQRINPLNSARIINAVKAELTKKAFTEDTASPDLKVSVAAVLKDKKSTSANTDYYAYGGDYRPWGWDTSLDAKGYTTYDLQNYKDGSLIIDIADTKTNNLVWEGVGNKQIGKPAKDLDAAISAAVASIMADFPPKGK